MIEQTERFSSVVSEYCSWAENGGETQANDLKKAISLLAELYSTILELTDERCGEDIASKEVTQDEWRDVFERFSSLPLQHYSVAYSPSTLDEAPVTGNVADDLADIYRDLKNGLSLYEDGCIPEAVWEWKFSFNTHWGRHVVSALHALHCYRVDKSIDL